MCADYWRPRLANQRTKAVPELSHLGTLGECPWVSLSVPEYPWVSLSVPTVPDYPWLSLTVPEYPWVSLTKTHQNNYKSTMLPAATTSYWSSSSSVSLKRIDAVMLRSGWWSESTSPSFFEAVFLAISARSYFCLFLVHDFNPRRAISRSWVVIHVLFNNITAIGDYFVSKSCQSLFSLWIM